MTVARLQLSRHSQFHQRRGVAVTRLLKVTVWHKKGTMAATVGGCGKVYFSFWDPELFSFKNIPQMSIFVLQDFFVFKMVIGIKWLVTENELVSDTFYNCKSKNLECLLSIWKA